LVLLLLRDARALPATLFAAAFDLGHDALDVGLHRILVDARPLLALLLLLALTASVGRVALGLDAHLASGPGARGRGRRRAADGTDRALRRASTSGSGRGPGRRGGGLDVRPLDVRGFQGRLRLHGRLG